MNQPALPLRIRPPRPPLKPKRLPSPAGKPIFRSKHLIQHAPTMARKSPQATTTPCATTITLHPPLMPETKTCQRCGRLIEWRAKWARNWQEIRFCSASCRSHRLTSLDRQLEQTIIDLLQSRPASSSLCPSEAARMTDPTDWQPLMEPTRQAARRLAARDIVEITQANQVVDPSTAKGPIRIRRAKNFGQNY